MKLAPLLPCVLSAVLLTASCQKKELGPRVANQRTSQARHRAAPLPPGTIQLVGVLTRRFQRRCKPGFKFEWVNPHLEVGFVVVKSGKGVATQLNSLVGKQVIVHGRAVGAYRSPAIGHEAACPPEQRRNDWVKGRGGWRLRRPLPPAAAAVRAFEVLKVEPFAGLTVTRKGTEMEVSFKNPFDTPLPKVVITGWYESCSPKTKPIAARQSRKLGSVKPGETRTTRLPAIFTPAPRRPGRKPRPHTPYSIQVTSTSTTNLLVLDSHVFEDPALVVKCPEGR